MDESCYAYEWVTTHGRALTAWQNLCVSQWVMAHMNESCHVWISRITYEWVIPQINESCHVRMSHVTCEWVMSHIWMSHVTYEWVMSHINESLPDVSALFCVSEWVIAHMNESCHIWMSHVTYDWVMSHIWMSHVTYEWVMSHINKSLPDVSASLRVSEWVKAHMNESVTYKSVVSRMNESCHMWMSHSSYEWVVLHINEFWLKWFMFIRVTAHSHITCATWLIHMCYDSFVGGMNM